MANAMVALPKGSMLNIRKESMLFRIFIMVGLVAPGSVASAQLPRPLPAKVDLGPEFQKFGLTPRAQGKRDTCSTFAITALAEFEVARNSPGPHLRLSEEFLIWAGNKASGLKGDQAMFTKATAGLNSLGICPDKLMPYANSKDAGRQPSAAALADARRLSRRWHIEWIRRWDLKRPLRDADVLAIKEALAKGHPVACGLRWPIALKGHELLKVLPAAKVADGHSIIFTGYQDDPKNNGTGVFLFRNSYGPRWGNNGYGVMSYAYARAYANDILWLRLGPPNSEVPTQRFEAEAMPVLAKSRCDTDSQEMNDWGRLLWSQGKQLFCRAQQGGFVELGFVVKKAGHYRLRALATVAPDFGRVRTALDGKMLPGEFDLYSGQVAPAGSLELGSHHLTAGRHRLRFTAIGKSSASTNYFFGIDAIDLIGVD